MQLDKIIIALRHRTPWEAMDLGVMLMRRMWPVIFIPWFLMMLVVLGFVVFAQLQHYWYFALFFLWWIKPVYESMLLFILSRGVFGEYAETGQVFSSTREWLKTGVLTTLFFWRLSPSRSFNMPVHQLEGLKGAQRRQRLETLHRVTGSHAMGVTVIGLLFEYILVMTLYALLFFILPDSTIEYIDSLVENTGDETWWYVIASIIYGVTLFVLEPFYVAAGFMLYLNRRTQLEGWDIELDFRNLAHRLEQSGRGVLKDVSNG